VKKYFFGRYRKMADRKEAGPLSDICERRRADENDITCMNGRETKLGKPSLLLNSCCGPCSTAVIERLAPDYDITVFFYNPNITDEEEYRKRLENQLKFIRKFNDDPAIPYSVKFREGEYEPEKFYEVCEKYAAEPEGGRRCQECFILRLEKTALTASMLNFDMFGTTLTVSPHKSYSAVSSIGRRMAEKYGVGFLDQDFKKKDGFKRSIVLSKKYGLYRQDYCGCEYSKRRPGK
jgi:predicted adenine nucleotide alpha hydrolase (AANH) superfamily ATPase